MLTNKVAVSRCEEYEINKIRETILDHFEKLGIGKDVFEGKKVVLKPNLLLGYSPEKAATTHPAVVEAAGRIALEYGAAEVILAESPGGLYSEKTLSSIYSATGMKKAAENAGFALNYDVSSVPIHLENGITAKSLEIIKPIADAEVILDLCKLKTHSLAGVTCAAKNLFGAIPGITKFEMHARFKEQREFLSMVADLNQFLMESKRIISICDAILCMEGNGPSAGKPRRGDLIITSENQFALDLFASDIVGMTGSVPLNDIAFGRGLCPSEPTMLEIIGENAENIRIPDFEKPGTSMSKTFALIPPFLQPRPVIDKSVCRGCGLCINSCPQKTIVKKDGKAFIKKENCIRCYCCQELCTFKAVKIKKLFVFRMFR